MKKCFYLIFILFIQLIKNEGGEIVAQNAYESSDLSETQEVLNEGKLEELFNKGDEMITDLERKVANIKMNFNSKLNGISNTLNFTIPKQVLKLRKLATQGTTLI